MYDPRRVDHHRRDTRGDGRHLEPVDDEVAEEGGVTHRGGGR